MNGMYYCEHCKKNTLHEFDEFMDVETDDNGYSSTYLVSEATCIECDRTTREPLTKARF
ncbi:hypothetical protein VMF7928_01039 [Vibrio marisflavi CECT 7928]|uniref:Uncharacterized protein n=1 Tax=Vibrio marisflavi CECT 7928 TaxID=634439 RepID=A0ABN8E1D9_9VIBR|nr:hypothetical protein VMF7928_01039 [Vibrio marisflavi CECT 7928]